MMVVFVGFAMYWKEENSSNEWFGNEEEDDVS
jgi:hypothetical protein